MRLYFILAEQCPENAPVKKAPEKIAPGNIPSRKIAPEKLFYEIVTVVNGINYDHKKLLFRCCGGRTFASEFIR